MSASLNMESFPKVPANEVVVVDDDKLTLEIVSWLIAKLPYKAHLFDDHECAYRHICVCPPRLLIVDYYMPGTTGTDFLQKLHYEVGLAETAKYVCSSVAHRYVSGELMSELNLQLLEKEVVCEKYQLQELLEKHLVKAS